MNQGTGACTLVDLVERHYPLLYRYAYRLTGSTADAEDLTQQAFLTAQLKLDQLRDQERAKSWLCMILRNLFLKDQRGPTEFPAGELLHAMELTDDNETGAAFDAAGPDGEQLQRALNELPEEFRSTVVLFYFQEFSYKEIAEQTGVAVGTVMSRLSRAKTYLRQRLGTEARAETLAVSHGV